MQKLRLFFRNDNYYGAFLITTMAILSSLNNSFIHATATKYAPVQIIFFKSLTALAVLKIILPYTNKQLSKSHALAWQITRAIFAFFGILIFTLSLRYLTIAETVVFSSSSAIFTSVGAQVFFMERITSKRWVALFISTIGVIIYNFYVSSVNVYLLFPILSALLFSCSSLCIKQVSEYDSTYTTLFYLLVSLVTLSIIPAYYYWLTPNLTDTVFILGAGFCYIIMQLALIEAYTFADAAFIAPFKFAKYPVNILAGFIFFAEWPNQHVFIGGSLILLIMVFLLALDKEKVKQHTTDKIG